jgi:undecaprenyl-diphosphatase
MGSRVTLGWLLDDLSLAMARYGPHAFAFLFAVLWFWPGPRSRRDRRQLAGVLAAASVLVALGMNQVIGWIWTRPRPFAGHPHTLLVPGAHDASFPSDHATIAFAAAVALFFLSRRLGLAALVFACFIAFARVYVGEHYLSDVLAGAAVGSLVALGIWTGRQYLETLLAPVLRLARRARLA